MSLFGAKLGSSFLFGDQFTSGDPVFAFEVDWARNGFFAGDVEGPIVSYRVQSGRSYFLNSDSTEFEDDDTGRITIVMADLDEKYVWSNTSSPLYPYVQAGKRFRLRIRYGVTTYPLAIGVITDIVNYKDDYGRKFVRIEAENHWRTLRKQSRKVTIPIQSSAYSDDIISAVLSSVTWPFGKNLQTGVDVYPYWWAESENAADLIYQIAHTELGSVYITADGTLVFRNRYDATPPSVNIGAGNIDENSLETSKPAENVRTLVSCKSQAITLTSTIVLFSATERVRVDPSGSVEVWCDYYYNSIICAAINCIDPVSGSDWNANTAADGTGTDVTASVSLSVSFFSARFKVSIRNNSPSVMAYVFFQARGQALARSSAITFEQEDITSVYEPSEFLFSTPWLQTEALARQLSVTLFDLLKIPRLIHSFDIAPDDVPLMLSMDLGVRSSVDATSLGIYGSYKVIKITQEYNAESAKLFRTRVTIEPVLLSGGSGSSVVPLTIPFTAGV